MNALMPDPQREDIGHELRGTLTALHLFLSLVVDGSAGPLNPTQTEYLGVAWRHLGHLRELVDGVFARPARDEPELEPTR